jgi:hypothetical protein
VRTCRCAEAARKRQLTLIVEVVLFAEEDHLVLEQRRVDLCGGGRVDTFGEPDAVDAGTDVGSEFDHMHVPKLTPDAATHQGSTQREHNRM